MKKKELGSVATVTSVLDTDYILYKTGDGIRKVQGKNARNNLDIGGVNLLNGTNRRYQGWVLNSFAIDNNGHLVANNNNYGTCSSNHINVKAGDIIILHFRCTAEKNLYQSQIYDNTNGIPFPNRVAINSGTGYYKKVYEFTEDVEISVRFYGTSADSGSAVFWDIMLEKGVIDTDWGMSVGDIQRPLIPENSSGNEPFITNGEWDLNKIVEALKLLQ